MDDTTDPAVQLRTLLLEHAKVLEQQATDREDRAAMFYGIGSSRYINSLSVAEGYRTEARALRVEARGLHSAVCSLTITTTAGSEISGSEQDRR